VKVTQGWRVVCVVNVCYLACADKNKGIDWLAVHAGLFCLHSCFALPPQGEPMSRQRGCSVEAYNHCVRWTSRKF
jgi:hypothetical protein